MHSPLACTEILALEERALNAWPAFQTVLVDGWVLRLAEGHTSRANSANALSPTGAFAPVRAMAEQLYPRYGLPTIFRITPLAGSAPDAILTDAGYTRMDETALMTVSLPDVPTLEDTNSGVTIYPTLQEEWCEGIAAVNDLNEVSRVRHDRILASLRVPSGFAVLKEDDEPVAYGLAVAERGIVGLFDIVTTPDRRRQGYGRQLVAALLGWGRRQGARTAYLQVTVVNHPALALYTALGFREAYRYHYRVCPSESRADG